MSTTGFGENDLPNEEEVIEDFLEQRPRARELRMMRAALEQRLDAFQREQERANDDLERAKLTSRIAQLHQQIDALRQEEAITQFVEDSVRLALHTPSEDDEV